MKIQLHIAGSAIVYKGKLYYTNDILDLTEEEINSYSVLQPKNSYRIIQEESNSTEPIVEVQEESISTYTKKKKKGE